MTIDPKQTLFNQPILKIREIVRYFTSREGRFREMESNLDEISRILNQPKPIAKEVLHQLLQQKYLQSKSREFDGTECYCYNPTQKGHLLSVSKGNPGITSAKAKLLVKELRERVDEVNKNQDFAYKVKRVKVEGGYSLQHQGLRDVDVFIWLKPSIEGDGFSEKRKERIRIAFERGRSLPTYYAQADWPAQEVKLFLNTRKKGLNLHFVNVFSFSKIR